MISLVCPTWNRGYCIANAIRSVIDQSYEDWELIIVDDGSTDNTEEVVRSFSSKKIKYFRTEHQGVGAARNLGISRSKGEFITAQDSDDISMPDRLEKLLPWIKKYDIVYSGLYIRSFDPIHKIFARMYFPAIKFNKKRLLKEQFLPGPCMFKREVWEKKPYRVEAGIADDWMAYLDWALSGFTFKAVNEGLYEYVRNWDSGTLLSVNDGSQKELFNNISKIVKDEYSEIVCSPSNL